MFDIPKLKLRDRTAEYATGKARVTQILEVAFDLMIEKGFAEITLREIARRCDIRIGAINYYYKSKTDLIQDLFEACLHPYYDAYETLVIDESLSAEERLASLIRLILEDLRNESTTKIFPDLWAMSNRDEFVRDLVDHIYERQRASFERLISAMNPGLDTQSRATLALFISASIEGQTMFVGYGKSQGHLMAAIENLAVTSFVNLAKTARNDQISALLGSESAAPDLTVANRLKQAVQDDNVKVAKKARSVSTASKRYRSTRV